MHAVLINQFYPPSQAPTGRLLRDLALALRARGHRVTVVTSPGSYEESSQGSPSSEDDGIIVRRVGPGGRHRSSLPRKAWDYGRFFVASYRALSRMEPPPSVIVSLTTPPFCGLVAARIKERCAIPYVLWCMDLYPEALAAAGIAGSAARYPLRLLARLARRERSGADCVVALGNDMAGLVRASAPTARVEVVPVWSAVVVTPARIAEARKLRRERGWADDEVVLLYSGHMGRAHAIDGIVRLATQLRRDGRAARVVLCGGGPARAAWERAAGDLVEWLPAVGEERLTAHLLSADIHVCTQRREWKGIVVPSKYPAACALGRPVVFTGPPDCAVAEWIREADTGWVLSASVPKDLGSLSAELCDPLLRRTKGRNAQAQAARLFSREANCGRLLHCVESSVSGIKR